MPSRFWKGEVTIKNFNLCCKNGNVQIPPLTPLPPYLRYLFESQVYHVQGGLQPLPGEAPDFAQAFIYDPDYASKIRIEGAARRAKSATSGLRAPIITELTAMLEECNPYVAKTLPKLVALSR
ncbi:MAG: hypothetical protein SEPTF4163_004450, partial [Sporothrix epigloea]